MSHRFLILPVTAILASGARTIAEPLCNDVVTQIDSAPDQGAQVNICPCFTPNEVAMTILDVPQGGTAVLKEIRILWKSAIGGQPDTLEGALIVYNMNQSGPANPATFVPLCSEVDGCILDGPVMQDGGLNAFDVSVFDIDLPASRFGIGLEFLTNQSQGNPFFIPSVASDSNGHNNAGGVVRNWVEVNGVSWQSSQSLGVSGDWIIRAVVTVCEVPCPWDFANGGDGSVGITDMLVLLALWGTNPGGPPDFNNDGNVGINDFLDLLGHWGPCG